MTPRWPRRTVLGWIPALPGWAGAVVLPRLAASQALIGAGGVSRVAGTVGAAAGVAAALGGPASAAPAPAAPAQPGERVAWPTVTLLDGQPFGPAQVAGRAVVVVFFTTSCPFCRRHNRHIQRLHAEAPPGLVVLGAARETDAALVRRHAAHEGYRFPITLQTEPLAAALSRRRLVPLTVTLARDGTLRQVIPGEMSEEDVLSLARLAAV